jgi:hypothetical protein
MSSLPHKQQSTARRAESSTRAKVIPRGEHSVRRARHDFAVHLKSAVIDDPRTSIRGIAIRLGLDDKTVGAWLNGEAPAPIDRLVAAAPSPMARALRAMADQIEGTPSPLTVDDLMVRAAEESGDKFKVRRTRTADGTWSEADHRAFCKEADEEIAALIAAKAASAREVSNT